MIKKYVLSITLSLLAFINPSVSFSEESKGAVYVMDDFSGGLISKSSPYGLPSRNATIAENVRFNTRYHSISKRSNLNTYGTADVIEPITGAFRHYKKDGTKVLLVTHGDELEKGDDATGTFTNILNLTTGDRRWQWVTWHDIAIGTDGYNQPIKYDGTSSSATYLGSLLATLDVSGSGPASGNYSYKVACYSTTYTILLNVASNQITANGNDVLLSMIPICTDTTLNGELTVGRKIYRTESGGSTYKLLSNGTIADNTTTTLTDSDADAALGGSMPSGDATWQVPKGRFILVQNNRLFLANDPSNHPSRLYYSEDGRHDVFINDSYKDIRQNDGDTITFVRSVLGTLTIGKNNSIQKLYINGADPVESWEVSDPLSTVGCQAPYSVTNSPLGIIYLAIDGIYRFTGQYSELLSESVTREIEDISSTNLENVWGIYHNNMYHMAYNSETVGGATNNRVLVLDVLAKAYSIDTLSINVFTAFNSGNDWGTLYAGSSENGKVYAYSSEVNEILHKTSSDFSGQWDDMRFIPESQGGDESSPTLEIARTETIDELSGTVNSLVGIIDRQDTVGYYTSQPIGMVANALDKVYWNESIPATGGDVEFRVRTSSTGESNLLYNDDFEFWDNWVTGTPATEQPNDWSYTQDGTGGSVDQSTTEVKRGTYSSKITKSNSGQSKLSFSIPNASNYQNKTLAFSAWVKSANSVASKVRVQITDGTTTTTTNYANGGGWEELEGTIAVSGSATSITFRCVVETGADAVAYFDRVMVRQASSVSNDWSAWSSAVTDSSGSDISGTPASNYVQYLIRMETSDITYSPNIIRVGQYNVRLTYTKEGTPQSDNIPFHYKTGYLDLGRPLNPKIIRSIKAYHEGSEGGTYTITITSYEGDSDTWTVDMSTDTTSYAEKTTNGALRGTLFTVDITNSGTAPFKFDKLVIEYDIEPYVAG